MHVEQPSLTLRAGAIPVKVESPDESLTTGLASSIVTRSRVMLQLIEEARVAAESRLPVLLVGETGTGKELFARYIGAVSNGPKSPLVAVNASAIPEALAESTLFGHRRGSFTGALSDQSGLIMQANGGTLFLDEISELPISIRAKLLRVLQNGTFRQVGAAHDTTANFRLVCATNRCIKPGGGFPSDLYYRIAGFEVRIPPLRDRVEDILPIAKAKLREANFPGGLAEDAKTMLVEHSWPGNVRELEYTIQRAVALANSLHPDLPIIRRSDLRIHQPDTANSVPSRKTHAFIPLTTPLRLLKVEYLRSFQAAFPDLTQAETGRRLGVVRSTINSHVRTKGPSKGGNLSGHRPV